MDTILSYRVTPIIPLTQSNGSVLAEYNALRSEITSRITIMYSILQFTIVALGAILTVGFAKDTNTSLILTYPYVAFFATLIYLSNIVVIHNLGMYIKEVIEPLMDQQYTHWEVRIQEHPRYGYRPYYIAAGLATFIGAPFLVLILFFKYVLHTTIPSLSAHPFFYLAIVSLIVTLILMLHSMFIINPTLRLKKGYRGL